MERTVLRSQFFYTEHQSLIEVPVSGQSKSVAQHLNTCQIGSGNRCIWSAKLETNGRLTRSTVHDGIRKQHRIDQIGAFFLESCSAEICDGFQTGVRCRGNDPESVGGLLGLGQRSGGECFAAGSQGKTCHPVKSTGSLASQPLDAIKSDHLSRYEFRIRL